MQENEKWSIKKIQKEIIKLIKNQRRNRNTRRRINDKDESEKHEYEKNKIGQGEPTPRIYREIFEKMKKTGETYERSSRHLYVDSK